MPIGLVQRLDSRHWRNRRDRRADHVIQKRQIENYVCPDHQPCIITHVDRPPPTTSTTETSTDPTSTPPYSSPLDPSTPSPSSPQPTSNSGGPTLTLTTYTTASPSSLSYVSPSYASSTTDGFSTSYTHPHTTDTLPSSSTTATSPSGTSTSTALVTAPPSSQSTSASQSLVAHKTPVGAIAGGIIVGLIFIAAAVVGAVLLWRARKRRRTPPSAEFMSGSSTLFQRMESPFPIRSSPLPFHRNTSFMDYLSPSPPRPNSGPPLLRPNS
jgi:hypothetical protein